MLRPGGGGSTREHIFRPSAGFSGQPTAPGRSGDTLGLGLNCGTFQTANVNCAFAPKGEDCNTFNCNIEWDEWNLVRAHVTPTDTVIEFGARYGTTSCVLAEATRNSGRVVAVEPDARAHETLLANRAANRCNFAVVLGTVSVMPLSLPHFSRNHYDQTTHISGAGKASLPNIASYHILEKRVGFNFTAVLIDCEGCIAFVNSTGLLASPAMHLVMIEEDMPTRVDYGVWYAELRRLGYKRVWHAFSRTATPGDRHSAWARGAYMTGPSCAHFRAKSGQGRNALRCLRNEGDDALNFRAWRAGVHMAV